MINKIKDIPDGTEVWVKMRRDEGLYDDDDGIRFRAVGKDGGWAYLDDENEVFTEEQLRERFSVNDGMPKQGDEIQVLCGDGIYSTNTHKFISFYKGKVVVESNQWGITTYPSWRFPPKKIQKTLAELEKELGYEEGTLEITN